MRKTVFIFFCLAMLLALLQPLSEPVSAKSRLAVANDIIHYAYRFKGASYVFGASMSAAPRYFDCSSFTKYVYGRFGIRLPRTSEDQARVGKRISISNLHKGDLLFFRVPGRGRGVGHVAIYIGNGRMIGTYGKGGVRISDINQYWKKRYLGARRVI